MDVTPLRRMDGSAESSQDECVCCEPLTSLGESNKRESDETLDSRLGKYERVYTQLVMLSKVPRDCDRRTILFLLPYSIYLEAWLPVDREVTIPTVVDNTNKRD